MDRRSFIKFSSVIGAGMAVSTGLAGCISNSLPHTNAVFTHGVASGE